MFLLGGLEWGIISACIVLVVAFGCMIYYFVYKAGLKAQTKNLWADRRNHLNRNKQNFNSLLAQYNFKRDINLSPKAYYQSSQLHDTFNFSVDFSQQLVAIASFEKDLYDPLVINFSDIASYKILNGITNSSSESYTSGAAIGGLGVVGVASTETFTETTIEQLKLRVDFADKYKPAKIIMIFKYRVDTSSDTHRMLVDTLEQMDSVLAKIIQANKEEAK